MRHSRVFAVALALIAFAFYSPVVTKATVASVVYENTSGPFVYTSAGEVGDTVTLAGIDRYLTRISIGVFCNGSQPFSDTFDLTLWTATGAGGTIGSQLWDSGSISRSLSGPLELISFEIPAVQVPDTLIWSVSHANSGNVFLQWSNPVTIGSSPDYAWTYKTQKQDPYFGTPANYMSQILAVPEPSSAVLLGLGALLLRRHKKSL